MNCLPPLHWVCWNCTLKGDSDKKNQPVQVHRNSIESMGPQRCIYLHEKHWKTHTPPAIDGSENILGGGWTNPFENDICQKEVIFTKFQGENSKRIWLKAPPRLPTNKKAPWYNQKLGCGWTNPIEKYARQNGNLPQIGFELPPRRELKNMLVKMGIFPK